MTPLYRPRKPINKVSDTTKSRASFYAAQRAELKRRCGGRCDSCGISLYEVGGDTDHVWGRAGSGAGLGWPWCDHVSALAALCRNCHRAKTDEVAPEMVEGLRRRSLQRMAEVYGVTPGDIWHAPREDLPGMARVIVAVAEAAGWRERLTGASHE